MIVESYEDVIIISGSLESNHWETIHTAIALTLKRHPAGVIIDCSGLTQMSPTGAETFHDAMDFIRDHDARIIMAAVPEPIMEVLRSVPEVRSQLPVVPTVEAARRSLDLGSDVDDDHGKKRKKLVAPENARKVLVCLYTGTGVEEDDSAMQVASLIADSFPSEIHLVCALLVPRHLPLQSALEDSERSAAYALDRAKQFFDQRNLAHIDRIERARDVAGALGEVLDEIDAFKIILPLSKDPMKVENNLAIVRAVTAKIEREVIFVRG
jgi:anti-anti-sigma regulatory factor